MLFTSVQPSPPPVLLFARHHWHTDVQHWNPAKACTPARSPLPIYMQTTNSCNECAQQHHVAIRACAFLCHCLLLFEGSSCPAGCQGLSGRSHVLVALPCTDMSSANGKMK